MRIGRCGGILREKLIKSSTDPLAMLPGRYVVAFRGTRRGSLGAERQKSLPARILLSEAPDAENAVKLSTERKHLTNVLKMVAYQIEGSLVELLRPHYSRTEDEGRTLIQTALRSSAAIEPNGQDVIDSILRRLQSKRCKPKDPFEPRPPPRLDALSLP